MNQDRPAASAEGTATRRDWKEAAKARRVLTVRAVCRCGAGIALVLLAATSVTGEWLAVVTLTLTLVLIGLAYRIADRPSIAGGLLLGVTWTCATLGTLSSGGLGSASFSWLLVTPILGGLLLGRRGVLLGTSLAAASMLALVTAHYNGLVPPTPFSRTEQLVQDLIDAAGVCLLTGLTVWVYLREWRWAEESMVRSIEELSDEVQERSAAEERFQSLFDVAPDGYYLTDLQGVLLATNRAAEELTGYSREELLGNNILDLGVLSDKTLAEELFAKNLEGLSTGPDEFSLNRKDGSTVPVEVRTRPVEMQGERVFLGVANDITVRKQAEEELLRAHAEQRHRLAARTAELANTQGALRDREEQYRRLVETTLEGIWILDPDNVVTFANQRMAEMLGYPLDEMVGSPVRTFVAERLPKAFAKEIEARRAGKVGEAEVHLQRKDGTEIAVLMATNLVVSDAGDPLGLLGMYVDITQYKQLEAQLRQSQKMEAIGLLAGGIAHDFNNLLTVINGRSEQALTAVGSAHPQGKHLEEIHRAGERAAALTRQLLAFSSQQVLEPSVLDLNDVVRDIEQLLLRSIGEDIELDLRLETKLDPVRADRTHMEQVLLNLALNARDAMPRGGRLTLATKNVELGANVAGDLSFRTEPGPYIELVVADDGSGMNEDTKARVFDPFFTTKEQGKGSGLGLSTVYGIVKQSEGYIWVESQPNRGTSFHVCLPRSEAALDIAKEVRAVPDSEGSDSETILLVEDEGGVRELAAEILRRKGYRVLEAENPQAALEICNRHVDSIDLLLTDMVMPGGSGQELASDVLALRPRTRVLYMSGYSQDRSLGKLGEPAPAFLAKPFSPGALAQKVRDVISAG